MTENTRLQEIRSKLPDIAVLDHPYDLGYWARHLGMAKPSDKDGSAGWLDRDAELRDEKRQ